METYHHASRNATPYVTAHRYEGSPLCFAVDSPTLALLAKCIPGGADVIRIVLPCDIWNPADADFADRLTEILLRYQAILVVTMNPRVRDTVCHATVRQGPGLIAADLGKPIRLARAYLNRRVDFRMLAAMSTPWDTRFPGYEIWRSTRTQGAAA